MSSQSTTSNTKKSDLTSRWEMNEDIVISGISGRFAESDNIDELAKNLFDNVDMITEDDRRWPLGEYQITMSTHLNCRQLIAFSILLKQVFMACQQDLVKSRILVNLMLNFSVSTVNKPT